MRVAIGLGCSLGDRHARLALTVHQLAAHPSLEVLRASRSYRTPPMRGGTASGWFLNGVVLVESALALDDLLAVCKRLERAADRRRARFWGDRTLDLDILLAEGVVLDEPHLVLPHPGIERRPFVLIPLVEVWPEALDPRTGRRFADVPEAPGPQPVPVGMLAARRGPLYGC